MDQFDQLRKDAVARRDRAMAAARDEYNETIASIDRLARMFGGKRKNVAYRPLTVVVQECLPADRSFTLGEMFEILEAAEPDRIFPAGTVRGCLHNLQKQGVVKRVGRKLGQVQWAVAGYESGNPFGAQTVRQAVEPLLREMGPLTLSEIVVNLQLRGYRPGADPRTVHENLRSSLRNCRDVFTRDTQKRWAIVG